MGYASRHMGHGRRATIAALRCLVVLAAVAWPGVAEASEPPWRELFDGKSLDGWEVPGMYNFINRGPVEVTEGRIVLAAGQPGTAIRYTGEVPKTDYEVVVEAMRVEGEDFFCCLSFPVGEKGALSLVVGGWGGTVCGLSLIDGEPAAENVTCILREFELKQWYSIRVRVTRAKVEAWIAKADKTEEEIAEENKAEKDETERNKTEATVPDKIVDFETGDHRLTLYFEDVSALPLGIATWRTTGAVRAVRLRPLAAEESKATKTRPESTAETPPVAERRTPPMPALHSLTPDD